MTNLKIAIIYSSIIGSILSEFEKDKKPVQDLKRQVKKFMYKRSRTNTKDFKEAIKRGEEVWTATLEEYKTGNVKIDAFYIIVALWSSHSELLAKFVNLSEKRIERFCMLNDSELLKAEQDAYKVASFINNMIKNDC